MEGTKREHRNKDSDGPRDGHFLVSVQETTPQATGGADECTEHPDAKAEQRGDGCGIVEPRSYWEVLMSS